MPRERRLLRAVRIPRRELTLVDGLSIHARSLDGPPGAATVVLVHGAGVSSRYMAPLLVQLARWFHAVAPDLPGFGRSQKPPRTLDIEGLADALLAWMDARNIARATLLGNSVGCQVVASLAARHPARVEAVILVGPTMDPAAPSLVRQGLRWLRAAFVEPPTLHLLLILEYASSGFIRFVRTIRAALRDPLEATLPRVQAPALVVRGARDPIVGSAWAERVAARLPRGRLVVIPRAGHAVNFDSPRALARCVRAFLRHDQR